MDAVFFNLYKKNRLGQYFGKTALNEESKESLLNVTRNRALCIVISLAEPDVLDFMKEEGIDLKVFQAGDEFVAFISSNIHFTFENFKVIDETGNRFQKGCRTIQITAKTDSQTYDIAIAHLFSIGEYSEEYFKIVSPLKEKFDLLFVSNDIIVEK